MILLVWSFLQICPLPHLIGRMVEGKMTKCSSARKLSSVLCCVIWFLLAAGCETPVGVERLDSVTAQRRLTANVLTTDELSPQARNVLRRWVLSERYDDDPAGAIAALHAIAADGRGDEDELVTLAEMAYLYGEKNQQRPYFLAAAIYSYAFLFPEARFRPPSLYDPRLRLAADLYSFGIARAFASTDNATVEFKSGGYELPFGQVQVAVNLSAFEWHNRRIVALSPVQDIAIRGLANRYRRPGVGAPLAAATQPIVAERGMQVAPRMKLPMTAVLRLDAPRRQLAQRELRATLDLYNTYDVATTTIAGKAVPLEARRFGSASSRRSSRASFRNRPRPSSPRSTPTGPGGFPWSLFTALPRVPGAGATWSMI
jgi:hypothetical protein